MKKRQVPQNILKRIGQKKQRKWAGQSAPAKYILAAGLMRDYRTKCRRRRRWHLTVKEYKSRREQGRKEKDFLGPISANVGDFYAD